MNQSLPTGGPSGLSPLVTMFSILIPWLTSTESSMTTPAKPTRSGSLAAKPPSPCLPSGVEKNVVAAMEHRMANHTGTSLSFGPKTLSCLRRMSQAVRYKGLTVSAIVLSPHFSLSRASITLLSYWGPHLK